MFFAAFSCVPDGLHDIIGNSLRFWFSFLVSPHYFQHPRRNGVLGKYFSLHERAVPLQTPWGHGTRRCFLWREVFLLSLVLLLRRVLQWMIVPLRRCHRAATGCALRRRVLQVASLVKASTFLVGTFSGSCNSLV